MDGFFFWDVSIRNSLRSNNILWKNCTWRLQDVLLLLSFPLWFVGAPTKEYVHPYSMMHRRLTTAGIDIAPHYHQILAMEGHNDSSFLKKLLAAARYLRLFLPQEPIGWPPRPRFFCLQCHILSYHTCVVAVDLFFVVGLCSYSLFTWGADVDPFGTAAGGGSCASAAAVLLGNCYWRQTSMLHIAKGCNYTNVQLVNCLLSARTLLYRK